MQPWPAALFEAYTSTHPHSGLLVLWRGEVVHRSFSRGFEESDLHLSFSLSKTVIALGVGLALRDGHLHSLQDPVSRYVPELADSAWKAVTIRQLLTMQSNVRFDERYTYPFSDVQRLSRTWIAQEGSMIGLLSQLSLRDGETSSTFRYSSADSQVLTIVLRRAVKEPLARYLQRTLSEPIGARSQARWLTDSAGEEAGYCCLAATIDFWARIGMLLQQEGLVGDRQLLPREWIRTMTAQDKATARSPTRAPYGFQVWLGSEPGRFQALGVRGQSVHVDQVLQLVMVQFGAWTTPVDTGLSLQREALWDQLRAFAEKQTATSSGR
jgi:CubicO group peptidase (beta-lactamase class C family)